MILRIFRFSVLFMALTYISQANSGTCSAFGDCRISGPNYPCGNWRNPTRVCSTSLDDPICLAERLDCRHNVFECVARGLVAYNATTACIGCVEAAIVTGASAAPACYLVCGMAPVLIERTVRACDR